MRCAREGGSGPSVFESPVAPARHHRAAFGRLSAAAVIMAPPPTARMFLALITAFTPRASTRSPSRALRHTAPAARLKIAHWKIVEGDVRVRRMIDQVVR